MSSNLPCTPLSTLALVLAMQSSATIGLASAKQAPNATHRAPTTDTLRRYDLLITEIMADPSPVVGLPDLEYVELHNASVRPVALSGVALLRGDRPMELPDTTLSAGAYLALADGAPDDDARFVDWPDLPTLTNAGGQLSLRTESGTLLDAVDYSPGWHASGLDDGGYALERIDLSLPCAAGPANWTSSTALAGGTPGAANAAAGKLTPDSLRITGVELVDERSLHVVTNRALDEPLARAFNLIGADSDGTYPSADDPQGYVLSLRDPLSRGVAAKVLLSPSASSCAQVEDVATKPVAFGLPLVPESGDWAINEIMYDPLSGEGRYVELANVSTALLSTADVRLSLIDEAGAIGEGFVPAAPLLVAPGGYAIFADDRPALLARFAGAAPSAVVATDVPTLSDQECLSLFDPATDTELERFCYRGDWHNRAYANTDGVSLERIDASAPPASAANWTSAATSAGGGTPARRNSQAVGGPSDVLPEGVFTLDRERLSPDGDGYEDLLTVHFAFDEPGTLLQFEVYDLSGRPVFTSQEDIGAGRRGTWTWDGVADDGEVAPVGTYVLRASRFRPDRAAQVEHLAFSLVGRI